MKKYLLLTLAMMIVLIGCTLKRSNPLDPNSHDIYIPGEITNIVITHSAAHTDNHWVQLKWDKLSAENADGYHVYRGQSYNGTCQRLDGTQGYPLINNLPNPTDSLPHPVIWIDPAQSVNTPNGIVPGDYYYKVSAYRRLNPNSQLVLEGHISSWVYTRVPQ
jgi:hypothetical protein